MGCSGFGSSVGRLVGRYMYSKRLCMLPVTADSARGLTGGCSIATSRSQALEQPANTGVTVQSIHEY